MKTSTQIALIGLASVAAAQFNALPACAKGCATSSLPANCNLDVKCICSDSSFISGISCCVKTSCSPSDQQMTLQVAQQLCDTVQVTLPSAPSCPGGAGPSAASSAASVASTSPSSVASSAASTALAMSSSAASMASGMSSSAAAGATSVSSTASAGASSIASTAGTVTGTPSSSATAASHSGGAVKDLGSKMGAVGAAVAALYLI